VYLAVEAEPATAIIDYLHAFLPYTLESQRSEIQQKEAPVNA
jgi:hypothetical protein